jgi:hypothetical protein
MKDEQFKKLVKAMRDAQKEYFRTRDKFIILPIAKELEAKVDKELSGQTDMFTNEE